MTGTEALRTVLSDERLAAKYREQLILNGLVYGPAGFELNGKKASTQTVSNVQKNTALYIYNTSKNNN